MTGFTSSDEGLSFSRMIEGFPNDVLSMLPPGRQLEAWQVRELLVRIRKDCTGEVFLNDEIKTVLNVRPKRAIRAGEGVAVDDIVDVSELRFQNVTIGNDEAVIYVFSLGWRRGLFFDFTPIAGPSPTDRAYSLSQLLGECFSHLAFTERLRITPDVWSEFTRQGWFPFITLRTETLRKMTAYAEKGWPIDELLDLIQKDLTSRLPALRSRIEKWPLADHRETLLKALGHFENDDYLSTCSMLYPRMEGIMRTVHERRRPADRPRSPDLIRSILSANVTGHGTASLLLPDRFRGFLEKVFFRGFVPGQPMEASRHTVAHGVIPESKMDRGAACVVLLTLDQISYLAHDNEG